MPPEMRGGPWPGIWRYSETTLTLVGNSIVTDWQCLPWRELEACGHTQKLTCPPGHIFHFLTSLKSGYITQVMASYKLLCNVLSCGSQTNGALFS